MPYTFINNTDMTKRFAAVFRKNVWFCSDNC